MRHLKHVIGRLYAFEAQIHFQLAAMMRGMGEISQSHSKPAILRFSGPARASSFSGVMAATAWLQKAKESLRNFCVGQI